MPFRCLGLHPRYIDALNEFAILAEMTKEQDSTSPRLGAVSPRVGLCGGQCAGVVSPQHTGSAIEEFFFWFYIVVSGWLYGVV